MATFLETVKTRLENWDRSAVLKNTSYIFLFLLFFVFFVFLSFPYSVLKESVSSQISNAIGMKLTVDSLSPSLPIGIKANGVKLTSKVNNKTLSLQQVHVNLSLLNMLVGRISIEVGLQKNRSGYLELNIADWFWYFLFSSGRPPSSIRLEADKFPLEELVNFGLSSVSVGPQYDAMLQPLLQKISLRGNLDGHIHFFPAADVSQIKASMNMKILESALAFDDKSLNISEQNFSKAGLVGTITDKGIFKFDEAQSGLKSEELDLQLKGGIALKEILARSSIDLDISLTLAGGLKESFGVILSIAGARDGVMNWKVAGNLGEYM